MPSQHTKKKEPENKHRNQRKELRICMYCGAKAPLVWVHGHGQCANCGINVEECCRGEQEKSE